MTGNIIMPREDKSNIDQDIKKLLGKYNTRTMQEYNDIVKWTNKYWEQTNILQKGTFVSNTGTYQ